MWEPPSRPWTQSAFGGAHDMASFLLAKKNMPQYYESHKWKIAVKFVGTYFCTEGDWHCLCMSLITGEQTTFKLLFWCFKAGSQHFALSMATIDAFEGRKAYITF